MIALIAYRHCASGFEVRFPPTEFIRHPVHVIPVSPDPVWHAFVDNELGGNPLLCVQLDRAF